MTALIALALAAGDKLDRYVYPLEPAIPSPPVTLDVSDLPEQRAWGEAAQKLVVQWFPELTRMLASERLRVPKAVHLIIKKDLEYPAYTVNDTITINGKWIAAHPDDLGMVIHELVHVLQQYPGSRTTPGWLVEGIADYIRWWRYEPEAPRTRVDPVKNKYTDAYRITASFLAWTSRKYDMRLVPALDRAMKMRRDPLHVFFRFTGKTVDALWQEYAGGLRG